MRTGAAFSGGKTTTCFPPEGLAGCGLEAGKGEGDEAGEGWAQATTAPRKIRATQQQNVLKIVPEYPEALLPLIPVGGSLLQA
jgi:hypothetical protein